MEAHPIDADSLLTTPGLVESWACQRLATLRQRRSPVSSHEWRTAVGGASVLSVAQRLGYEHARPMLRAFGIFDMSVQHAVMDWAMSLPLHAMSEVREMAARVGVGPVLAALELAGYMSMYSELAKHAGVETYRGLAWR